MPIQVRCYQPIQGRVIRVVGLNSCGVAISGTGGTGGVAQMVMDGFTQVAQEFHYEEGTRKFSRKADGTPCVNFQNEEDALTEIQATIDFCVWHPGMITTTVAGRLLTASESPTGTGFAVMEGVSGKHWSLEVWQNVVGDYACDPVTGQQRYVYNAWPHLWNTKIGNSSINADPTLLQLIATTRKASPLWVAGNPWMGNAPPQQSDHWLNNLTTVAPPTSGCIIGDYP
jgi:hypothetical protein